MWILVESWKPLVGLFAAMIAVLEVGRFIGRRRLRADPEGHSRGAGALESTILALLGLLLAFTFSGAWARFEARRELILKETNIIGTAWLRLDLLPEPARARLQESFRRYVELRLESTQRVDTKLPASLAALQQSIWADAIAARSGSNLPIAQLLLPALNDMFDVAGERYFAVKEHPPALVFVMLLVITLLATLLAGYGMAAGKHRHWMHVGCFVVGLLLAIYVTLDLEYPRAGLIRVDSYDQLLVDLRAGMK